MADEPRDRRLELRGHPTLNGIDFIRVATPTQLQVFFLNKNNLSGVITRASIAGGESVTGIRVTTDVTRAASFTQGDPLILTLGTDRTGDFSEYTLILEGEPSRLD